VIGQDIQETDDGRFVIAQGVAPDRVISVVDPQARHGHKSNARGFDGYKGHVAIDPDSEVITAAEVGAANAGDAAMAPALLADLPVPADGDTPPTAEAAPSGLPPAVTTDQAPVMYGDAAYGTGALLADLEQRGVTAMTKVAGPTAPHGHFSKDRFHIDLDAGKVTCPARLTVAIIPARGVAGWRALAAPARCARWHQPVPAARPAAPSPSTRRRHGCRRPDAASGIRPGGPTTAPTAPPWNASWRTCCAAATAADEPVCGAWCGWRRTGGCWPPRSTWPAWLPWASATDRAAGPSQPSEPQGQGRASPTSVPPLSSTSPTNPRQPPSPTLSEAHWPPHS
jgi:Transposase DDE domain